MLSANRVDLGFFFVYKFSNFTLAPFHQYSSSKFPSFYSPPPLAQRSRPSTNTIQRTSAEIAARYEGCGRRRPEKLDWLFRHTHHRWNRRPISSTASQEPSLVGLRTRLWPGRALTPPRRRHVIISGRGRLFWCLFYSAHCSVRSRHQQWWCQAADVRLHTRLRRHIRYDSNLPYFLDTSIFKYSLFISPFHILQCSYMQFWLHLRISWSRLRRWGQWPSRTSLPGRLSPWVLRSRCRVPSRTVHVYAFSFGLEIPQSQKRLNFWIYPR